MPERKVIVTREYTVRVPNDLVLLESYLDPEDNADGREWYNNTLADIFSQLPIEATPEEIHQARETFEGLLVENIADWLTYEHDSGEDAGLVEITDVRYEEIEDGEPQES